MAVIDGSVTEKGRMAAVYSSVQTWSVYRTPDKWLPIQSIVYSNIQPYTSLFLNMSLPMLPSFGMSVFICHLSPLSLVLASQNKNNLHCPKRCRKLKPEAIFKFRQGAMMVPPKLFWLRTPMQWLQVWEIRSSIPWKELRTKYKAYCGRSSMFL